MYLCAQIRKTSGKSLQLVFRGEDFSWIEAQEDPYLGKLPVVGLAKVEFKNPVVGQKLFVSNPETVKMTPVEFENAIAEKGFKGEEFALNDLSLMSVDCMYIEKDRRSTEPLRTEIFVKKSQFKIPPGL